MFFSEPVDLESESWLFKELLERRIEFRERYFVDFSFDFCEVTRGQSSLS